MSLAASRVAHGVLGRSTTANDTPGAMRYSTYVDSSGNITNDRQLLIRIYNGTGSDSVAGGIYQVTYDSDVSKSPKFIAAATSAVYNEYVVTPSVITNATFGWAVLAGHVDMRVGNGTAAGDFVKGVNAATHGVTDATTKSDKSLAMCITGNSSGSTDVRRCDFLGGNHTL